MQNEVLALDSSGNVYLAGNAGPGLPIPSGSTPFQPASVGTNAAILKLNGTGTAVVYGTYLGGSGTENLTGIAVDADGGAYVSGITTSNDFPTKNPLQPTLGSSGQSGFVTKLNPDGTALIYSSYLGLNSTAAARGIALDSSKNIYVAGSATSGFPTTSGSFQTTCSTQCGFVTKLDSGGSLLYSSYLGGSAAGDSVDGIGVDSMGNFFLTGVTHSPAFPGGSAAPACGGIASSVFVAGFSSSNSFRFATCLGDNFNTGLNTGFSTLPALALDHAGNVYIAASSDASLVLQNPIDSVQPPSGTNRPFISEVDPLTGQLLFSTFAGSVTVTSSGNRMASGDQLNAIAVDSNGGIYAAGFSAGTGAETSEGFPLFNALQSLFDVRLPLTARPPFTFTDAIIMKIAPTAGAAAAVAPGNLQFIAAQAVGTTSAPQAISVLDLGTTPLTVSSVTASGDFSVLSRNCGVVPAFGSSCTIQVTFSPTASGTRTGVVTINDSSAGSPRLVDVSGQGSDPEVSLAPTSLSFANQSVGTTSAALPLTLTNIGALDMQITRVQASGEFTENNNCGVTLPAHASCTIQVTFAPTTVGAQTGSITVTDNAVSSPQSVPLSGAATSSATISVSPPSLSFPVVSVGATSEAQAIRLSNSGSAVISIPNISVTDEFAETNDCGTSLPGGGSCTIEVTFSPTSTGVKSGTVSITDNAAGNPHTVALTGNVPQGFTISSGTTPPLLRWLQEERQTST